MACPFCHQIRVTVHHDKLEACWIDTAHDGRTDKVVTYAEGGGGFSVVIRHHQNG